MNSALYEGTVRHRRREPFAHEFRYRMFQVYLDLDELETVFRGRWLWSAKGPNLAWFLRSDHLGDPQVPLARAVRDLVEERLGWRPQGPVRLLTHLRYFGYVMNPVSFYYCFDAAGERVEAIVAEVHNTPWGERHCYALDRRAAAARPFEFGKQFHVSPFFGMNQRYRWSFGEPGPALAVQMENWQDGREVFDATLAMERKPISAATLALALARYPAMTLQVVAAIYWQALRLRLRGAPFHSHPKHTAHAAEAGEVKA